MEKAPLLCVLALGLAGCGAATASGPGTGAGAAQAGAPGSGAFRDRVVAQPSPGACHARGSGLFTLPDPHCTPGAVDPRVTQTDIATTICRRGYTRSVRPPESVTYVEKRASMRAYGDHGSTRHYEYDHLIALELGGAPNDPRNLWPEPGATPNPKDALETRLRERVCTGALSLGAARREIAADWVAAYRRVIGPAPTQAGGQ